MERINHKRLLVGGLASGFVMNAGEAALHAGVLGADAAAQFKRFGLSDNPAGWQLPALITPRLAWIPVAWGLVEAPLGTLVGACIYRE